MDDDLRKRLDEALLGFGQGARTQLLHVLQMGSKARALLIAELYEDAKTRLLAELLMDLEVDDMVRATVQDALAQLNGYA